MRHLITLTLTAVIFAVARPCVPEVPLVDLAPLQVTNNLIFWDHKPIRPVRPQARALLIDLSDHADHFVPPATLQKILWPEMELPPDPTAISTHIRVLKHELLAAFTEVDKSFDRIEHLQGLGYRWRDSVKPPTFKYRHGIWVSEDAGLIYHGDKTSKPSPCQWRILQELWQNSPGFVPDETLQNIVAQFARDRSKPMPEPQLRELLTVNIYRIRKHLGTESGLLMLPRVPGVGYAWVPQPICPDLLLDSTAWQVNSQATAPLVNAR